MAKIACAHPGKIGDALYALPTVRELCRRHGAKADFYTSDYCRPLTKLFEAQDCIDRFIVAEGYRVRSFNCGAQPWQVPVPRSGYGAIYQLGFESMPDRALPDYIAVRAGVSQGLPIHYDFSTAETLQEPYIVIAPRGPTSFSALFNQVIEKSPVTVVEIGATGEGTGSKRSVDRTGLDMLETLPWIAGSKGFVSLMSSPLALANGFAIPKVVPHDGTHWDMRHVLRSLYNHYPVHPSTERVLELLGLRMTYCKTLDPVDYEVFHEMKHAATIKGIVGTYNGRFEHPHRAWEYGLVLRALREHKCQTVLDVGGGGSLFAPAAAWIDIDVTQVDPDDYVAWVMQQSTILKKQLKYVRQDFMGYQNNQNFDAVTCISVLEHIPDDANFFKRLASFVKPGGLLAVTVDFWPDGQQKRGDHLRTYNERSLRALAELLPSFEFLGEPDYSRIGGHVYGYTFASMVLRVPG